MLTKAWLPRDARSYHRSPCRPNRTRRKQSSWGLGKAPGRGASPDASGEALGRLLGLDVDGAVAAAVVLLQLVADALVAVQSAHSGRLDGADVDVSVAASVVRLDEAETLVGVEELNCSADHCNDSFWRAADDRQPDARSGEREGKRSRKAPMTVNLRLIAELT